MFSLITYLLIIAAGFMMGYLFKRANINTQILSPNPSKALKIFILVFTAAILITFSLSYFTTRALSNSEIPEASNIHYNNLQSIMIFSINLFFFLLVVLANGYSQTLKKFAPFPYVLAFGFYAIFILKDAYVINDYYILWQKSVQLVKGDIPDLTKTAWTKCFIGLVVTLFNAGMIRWSLKENR